MIYAFIIWGCAVLFYLFQSIIRVSPSVMMDDIMIAFQLDATGFATLSAVAPYCYSLLQIPVGIIIDVFYPRKVILICLLLCLIGIISFASSSYLYLAYLGRILIGTGSAAAFICVSKLNTTWFPDRFQATIFSMTIIAGMIGALNGGAPLVMLMEAFGGWRQALFFLTFFGAVIWILNFFILKDAPRKEVFQHNWTDIWKVFCSSQAWIYALTGLGIYLSITVFADLWGTSFLLQRLNIDKTTASKLSSLIYIGFCFGSLSIGWLSDRFHSRKMLITIGSGSLFICMVFLVYSSSLNLLNAQVVLFLLGFFAGVEMLCFIGAYATVNPTLAATITGFINAVVMMGGAMMQHLAGWFLDLSWSGTYTDVGIKNYTISDYRFALSFTVFMVFVSLIASLFIDQKHEKTIGV